MTHPPQPDKKALLEGIKGGARGSGQRQQRQRAHGGSGAARAGGRPDAEPATRSASAAEAQRWVDRVLDLEFFHKLNRIVFCDNLVFVMHAEILRQNMQQGVLGFLKVNVELLLLFLVEIIKIKKGVPGQTPPILRRVQRLGGLIG